MSLLLALTVSPPPVPEITGGHYGAWWAKEWAKQFEKKLPDIEEIEEFVEESPVEAIKALEKISPQIALGVTPEILLNNSRLIQSISEQLLIAIELKRIEQAEDDDIEAFLLLI